MWKLRYAIWKPPQETGNSLPNMHWGSCTCRERRSRDKEKAVRYLEASAAQGNLYAKFLLEHLDSFRDPSTFLAATRLLHRLEMSVP